MMRHLVCYVWPSTKGNHAGMAHMCDLLKAEYPKEFRNFKIYPKPSKFYLKSIYLSRVVRFLLRKLHDLNYKYQYKRFIKNLNKGDEVYLLEYLLPECNQNKIAIEIQNLGLGIKIIGLAHLTPSALLSVLTKDEIKEWVKYVDIIMTLGSSLTNFLESCSIKKDKIKTGFHYVDHNYFKPTVSIHVNNPVKIIVVGSLQRNFDLLKLIINRVKNADFIIFTGGNSNILSYFENYSNVSLKGYVSEDELKMEMDTCDISLNVMDDTIGSNVITTSLSMGLAMIVSNVGSIRDYCDEKSAVFCNTEDDFVNAINLLLSNPELLSTMKSEAIHQSKRLHIQNFYQFLSAF